jgi:hypothetical protein
MTRVDFYVQSFISGLTPMIFNLAPTSFPIAAKVPSLEAVCPHTLKHSIAKFYFSPDPDFMPVKEDPEDCEYCDNTNRHPAPMEEFYDCRTETPTVLL